MPLPLIPIGIAVAIGYLGSKTGIGKKLISAARELFRSKIFEYLWYWGTNLSIIIVPYSLVYFGAITDNENLILYTMILCIELWWLKNLCVGLCVTGYLCYKAKSFKPDTVINKAIDLKTKREGWLEWLISHFPSNRERIKKELYEHCLYGVALFGLYYVIFDFFVSPYLEGADARVLKTLVQAFVKVFPVIQQNAPWSVVAIIVLTAFTAITLLVFPKLKLDFENEKFLSGCKFFTTTVTLGCAIPFMLAVYVKALPMPLLICVFVFGVIKYFLWGLEMYLEEYEEDD